MNRPVAAGRFEDEREICLVSNRMYHVMEVGAMTAVTRRMFAVLLLVCVALMVVGAVASFGVDTVVTAVLILAAVTAWVTLAVMVHRDWKRS